VCLPLVSSAGLSLGCVPEPGPANPAGDAAGLSGHDPRAGNGERLPADDAGEILGDGGSPPAPLPGRGGLAFPQPSAGRTAGLLSGFSKTSPHREELSADHAGALVSGEAAAGPELGPLQSLGQSALVTAFLAAGHSYPRPAARGREALTADLAGVLIAFRQFQAYRPAIAEPCEAGAVPVQGVPVLAEALEMVPHPAGLPPAPQAESHS